MFTSETPETEHIMQALKMIHNKMLKRLGKGMECNSLF